MKIFYIFLTILFIFSNAYDVKNCIKSMPSSLSKTEKEILCSKPDVHNEHSILVRCVLQGKSKLNLKFDESILLCEGVSGVGLSSSALMPPVQCLSSFLSNPADRNFKSLGFTLCQNVSSSLPVDCWHSFKNLKYLINENGKSEHNLKLSDVVDFCRNSLQDISSLECILVSTNNAQKLHLSVGVKKVLSACVSTSPRILIRPAITDVTLKYPIRLEKESFEYCLNDMKEIYSAELRTANKKAGHLEDILHFCVLSSIAAIHSDSGNNVHQSVECFKTLDNYFQPLLHSSQHSGHVILTRDRLLGICQGADSASGPSDCVFAAVNETADRNTKLTGDEVEELCALAHSRGPVDCFHKAVNVNLAQNLNDKKKIIGVRTALCAGAVNLSPVDCFQYVTNGASIPLFKNDVNGKILLCNRALFSTAPAVCASKAQSYLTSPDIISLCASAENDHYRTVDVSNNAEFIRYATAPVECLKVLEHSYKNFVNSPKKALGTKVDASEAEARDKLLSLCSYAFNNEPLLSAHCFKNAPVNLDFNDVIYMCLNVTSATHSDSGSAHSLLGSPENSEASDAVLLSMKMCMKILGPKGWKSHDITVLCTAHFDSADEDEAASKISGKTQEKQIREEIQQANTNGIIKCAKFVNQVLRYSRLEAAYICRLESSEIKVPSNNAVLNSLMGDPTLQNIGPIGLCASTAIPSPSVSSDSSGKIPAIVIREVCERASTGSFNEVNIQARNAILLGQCLAEVYSFHSSNILNTLLSISNPVVLPTDLLADELTDYIFSSDHRFSISDYLGKLCSVDRTTLEQSYSTNITSKIVSLNSFGFRIDCIRKLTSRFPSRSEVSSCLEGIVSLPTSAKVLWLANPANGENHVTAGQVFSMAIQILDQFGNVMNKLPTFTLADGIKENSLNSFRVSLSINENNKQGAVILGSTSNYTMTAKDHDISNGFVEFKRVIITQPGHVQLKISIHVPELLKLYYGHHMDHSHTHEPAFIDEILLKPVTLASFYLSVHEDPVLKDTSQCLFLFTHSMCHYERSKVDAEGDFPFVRSWLPHKYYLQLLSCGHIYENWRVSLGVGENPSTMGDGIWTEYRLGIVAIWTGGSVYGDPDTMLPRSEQPPNIRLGFVESVLSKREIRKAYYRKSLIWHPDKWGSVLSPSSSGAPSPYVEIVNNVFEVISDAYTQLLEGENVN